MARGFRPRRRLVVAAAVLLIVAAGAGVWLSRRSTPGPQATTTTVKVTTTTLSQTVTASGTIAPKSRSDLRFTSGGTVTNIAVKAGDQVTAGQTLASIDPTDLQQAVDSAQASVDAAYASLSATRSNSAATSTQVAAANSQVKAANAKLDTAKTALAAANLQSPITGTVAAVNIQVGNQVSGNGSGSGSGSSSGSGSGSASASGSASGAGTGSGSGSGQSGSGGSSSSSSGQIVVITTDAWLVDTSVTAADLPLVKADLQAQIVPTGSSATVFGTVSSVGVIATTTSGVASFPVTVSVTGNPTGLYAGGAASVSIIVKEVTDALVVPTAAITTADGKTVVTQVRNGQQVSTPVTVGMVQGNQTQITAGLANGDEVLVTRSGATPGQGGAGSTATRTRGTGGFGGGSSTGGPPAGAGQGGAPSGAPAGAGQGAPPAGGGQ